MGDILNSHPGNYYHYEPLLHFNINQIRDNSPLVSEATKIIKALFKCDYSDLGNFKKHAN